MNFIPIDFLPAFIDHAFQNSVHSAGKIVPIGWRNTKISLCGKRLLLFGSRHSD
jgi:hypothetical protein